MTLTPSFSGPEALIPLLLVEDNNGDARLVRELLQEAYQGPGFTVTHVHTLAEAEARLEAEAFPVVLLDLGLPDSSGLASVERVHAKAPDAALVVLTGLDDQRMALDALHVGGQDYLVKGAADGDLIARTLHFALERQQNQHALHRSRERYRTLVERAPEAIVLVDESRTIHYANPATACLLRVAQTDELVKTSLLDWVTPRCHALVIETLDRALAADPSSARECVFTATDGSPREVEFVAVPAFEGDGPSLQVLIRDISDRLARARYERMTAAVFETAGEAMMMTDAHGRIEAVNPAFTTITGYTLDEVRGRTPRLLASGRHDNAFYTDMFAELGRTGRWQGDIWNRRRDGEVYVQRLTITRVTDDADAVTNYVAVFSDVTEEKRVTERIRYHAEYDALTGLPNRLLLLDRLKQGIEEARRDEGTLALLFVDLDGFKPVNDTHGHVMGDRVLQEVARRLAACVRNSDTVARLGGDEFVILLRQLQHRDDAIRVTCQALRALQKPFPLDNVVIQIGASIGLGFFPHDAKDASDLMQQADEAMYEAKRQGKGTFALAGDRDAVGPRPDGIPQRSHGREGQGRGENGGDGKDGTTDGPRPADLILAKRGFASDSGCDSSSGWTGLRTG